MAEIKPYEQQILPQGQSGGRSANANDMGFAQGIANLGAGITQAGDTFQQMNEAEDITNIHVQMAKSEAAWAEHLQERTRTAKPGDDTFASTVMSDMSDYMQVSRDMVKTRKGEQLFDQMAANTVHQFGVQAIGIQAQLAGQAAKIAHKDLSDSFSSTAYIDPTQKESLITKANAAIDDPNGMYGKVSQVDRDAFKAEMKANITFASYSKIAQVNPKGILDRMAPELSAQFSEQLPPVVTPNPTGIAPITVAPAVKKFQPVVENAGVKFGVNPNVLLAQMHVESGGNVNALSPKGAQGVMQFMPATATRFKVDVSNPESSVNGAANYMNVLLKQFGGDYQKALAGYNWGEGNLQKSIDKYGDNWMAHAPAETRSYVQKIMTISGEAQSTPPPYKAESQAPDLVSAKPSVQVQGLDGFSELTWEQQQHLVKTAEVALHSNETAGARQRAEADRLKKDAQDAQMQKFLPRIIDSQAEGGALSDQEILSDKTLDWQQKQHLVDYKITRAHELANGLENKTNPAKVRELMLQIHASDDDPRKSYNMDPVMEAYKSGAISTDEMKGLRTEVEQMRNGNNNGFQKDVHTVKELVYQSFTRSIEGTIEPEKAIGAAYVFSRELDNAIEKKRKANEDPRSLLDLSSKDYMLKPERLRSYLGTPSAAVGSAISKVKANQQVANAGLPSYKDFDSLPKGTIFLDPQGNQRTKQ